jgi:hypothetical protein
MTDIVYQDYVCHSSMLMEHIRFQEWGLSINSDNLLAFYEKFVSLQFLYDRDRRNSNRNGSVSATLFPHVSSRGLRRDFHEILCDYYVIIDRHKLV